MKILFVYSGNGDFNSSVVMNQARSLKNLNIDLDYYPVNNKGIWGYLKHMILLRRYLHHANYTIIHAHYGLCGIVAFVSRRKEKIIVSFMGDDLLGSNRLNGKISLISKLLTKINIILSKRCYDFSIVKSEEMFQKLKINDNVCVCPNGVDLEVFTPVDEEEAYLKSGFSKDKINLIFVSDPARREKNYSLAQSAIELIKNNSIQLHVIKKAITEDLKYYYSAADVLIMTSLHEGSPNVIKEAMACNCPIVSTDVGDVKTIIGNTHGCYISAFNPAEVAEKIKSAINFCQTDGRTKGRERIIEIGLDSKGIANRIVDIYSKVLV